MRFASERSLTEFRALARDFRGDPIERLINWSANRRINRRSYNRAEINAGYYARIGMSVIRTNEQLVTEPFALCTNVVQRSETWPPHGSR